jgi:pyruvate formate lyase activating enzyme
MGAVAGGVAACWLGARALRIGEKLSAVDANAGNAAAIAGPSAEVFKGGAPSRELFDAWRKRGWARDARHWSAVGRNIRCGLCPNRCLLEIGDRGRCRNRVNVDGRLYTMAYANPCSFNMDPVEKKPLFHFMPGTWTFSLATAGCCFRCLNCQNWEISQTSPEQTKDASGPVMRLGPQGLFSQQVRAYSANLSASPDDVADIAEFYRRNAFFPGRSDFRCRSVSYTYSEPTVFLEYMTDCCRAVRQRGLKNIVVTCGYIQAEPLEELCGVIDAAHVDLKGFDEKVYKELNSGGLKPILDCLLGMKRRGVWFEVINLVVPTYTDKQEMIARMCDWLVKNLGPDTPLHFSRFSPLHKLKHLPPTPAETLVAARDTARKAGLNHVYIGNIRGIDGAETTFCPSCKKAVVVREGYLVQQMSVSAEGKCGFCGGRVAGLWAV